MMFDLLPSDLANTTAMVIANMILTMLAGVLTVRPTWVNLTRRWLWFVIPVTLFTSLLYGLEFGNPGTLWPRMWLYLVLVMALTAGVVMTFPLQFARGWLFIRFRGGSPRMAMAFFALLSSDLLIVGAYAFGSKIMATIKSQFIPTYWDTIQNTAYAWASNVLCLAIWVAAIWLVIKVSRRSSGWFLSTSFGNRIGYYAVTFRQWMNAKASHLRQRVTRRRRP